MFCRAEQENRNFLHEFTKTHHYKTGHISSVEGNYTLTNEKKKLFTKFIGSTFTF